MQIELSIASLAVLSRLKTGVESLCLTYRKFDKFHFVFDGTKEGILGVNCASFNFERMRYFMYEQLAIIVYTCSTI